MKNTKFNLVVYDKYETHLHNRQGKILLQNKSTADGFLEHIIKKGFDNNVFEITYSNNSITYSFQIGEFEKRKRENDLGKIAINQIKNIATGLNQIFDLHEYLQKK